LWPFTKSIYTNSWRRVSHGIRESWDYVREGVTQIDERERERERERGEEHPGECQKIVPLEYGSKQHWILTDDKCIVVIILKEEIL
jgi:hypothetical protein